MSTEDLFNLFLIVSALHGFVFSILLFYSKNGRDRTMIYLNLLVLVISLNNFQSWVLAKHLFQHKFMLGYIQVPWHFLTAPLFYAFLTHYLKIEERSIKIFKYILPLFILAIILQVSFVLFYNNNASNVELDYIYEKYTSFEEIISFIVSISVFVYTFYILYKKEKLFPKILTFDNLHWIYTFFKLGALIYILWIAALIIKVNMDFSGFLFSYYPLRIALTLLIYWMGYQGFIQLRMLKERQQIRTSLVTEINNLVVENKKPISLKEIDKHLEQFNEIDTFIKQSKKYLIPKYTLQNLSEDLNLSTSTLSLIINNNAHKSFIDYTNEMRIEQAKKLLLTTKYSDYTIASVGLESGFNSKSSFYAVFKKHVGSTPVQFKNNKK